jgi:hypothetical protein
MEKSGPSFDLFLMPTALGERPGVTTRIRNVNGPVVA